MSQIVFPTDPEIGQEYTEGDRVWRWNGFTWRAIASSLVTIGNQLAQLSTTVENIDQSKAESAQFTTTILSTDEWDDGNGFFTLTKEIVGILSTDNPVADIDLGAASLEEINNIQEAWADIYYIETNTDEVIFYALDEPNFSENTVVRFKVVR